LATHLDRFEDFRLDDPHHMAFRTSWRHPAPLVKDAADVRRMAVPEKSFYQSAGYGDLVRQMRAHAGDRVGLCGDCDSATLAFCVSLRGMHQALIDLIDEPKLVHALMEKGTACAIERGKFLLDAGLRILRLNDSVGNMSVISPEQWNGFIYPHMKTVCDELRRYCPEMKIYCHICGNVLPIAGRLPEAGLDCIAPLDPLGGFTVADVRRAVGDEVVLMGGVNTLSFIQSSRSEIRDEALRCIEQGGRRGRFILGSGCALPSQSRRENIEALVEAAERFAPNQP
jgi:uroporphyrinogen-III decarboxylase